MTTISRAAVGAILMSGAMVRATIREIEQPGTGKRETRRLVTGVPEAPAHDNVHPRHQPKHSAPYLDSYCSAKKTAANPRGMSENWCWWTRDDRPDSQFKVRYVPGQLLWVREAWRTPSNLNGKPSDLARSCKDAGWHSPWCPIQWEADGSQTNWADWCGASPGRLRASMHLPREFSRLTLEVTAVKVERLQDISEEDAKAEGATSRPNSSGFQGHYDGWSMDWSSVGTHSQYASGGPGPLTERDVSLGSPVHAFASYINELHGGPRWNLKPTNLWDQNPWIVAVTFKPHRWNIDQFIAARSADPIIEERELR